TQPAISSGSSTTAESSTPARLETLSLVVLMAASEEFVGSVATPMQESRTKVPTCVYFPTQPSICACFSQKTAIGDSFSRKMTTFHDNLPKIRRIHGMATSTVRGISRVRMVDRPPQPTGSDSTTPLGHRGAASNI